MMTRLAKNVPAPDEEGGDATCALLRAELAGKAFPYEGKDVSMLVGHYANGRAAIRLISAGEPLATLTVNTFDTLHEELREGDFLVKTWSENESVAEAALASGLFVDTGRRIKLGFISVHVWRLASRTSDVARAVEAEKVFSRALQMQNEIRITRLGDDETDASLRARGTARARGEEEPSPIFGVGAEAKVGYIDAETPGLALSAMALALRAVRPVVGEEDFRRMRACLCGGNVVLHRGETVMTFVHALAEKVRKAVPDPVARMIFEGDFSEADWGRAFDAVEKLTEASREVEEAQRDPLDMSGTFSLRRAKEIAASVLAEDRAEEAEPQSLGDFDT